jgi:3-oxoacyl-[acyl-carrier protein] reductase
MSDYLIKLASQPATRSLIKAIGLPMPRQLKRGAGGYAAKPLSGVEVLVGAAPGGFAVNALKDALKSCGAQIVPESGLAENQTAPALVFDATGLNEPGDLSALYGFFHPLLPRIGNCGRVLLVTGAPDAAKSSAQAAAWRGVEGFMRSMAKEIGKRGATANLLYSVPGAESRLEGPLRFFLTAHSAYVDGQPLTVSDAVHWPKKVPFSQALQGKIALVTGGARGIGAATAQRLAAEGAHVVCLDIPADQDTLNQTVTGIGGTALPLDITDAAAPARIVEFLTEKFGGVDIVVHNAGVTRDKTLAKMPEHFWNMVLQINLASIVRIDAELHAQKTLRDEGRIVVLSSIGGIAGNVGQTNYGATKAGLIGYVRAEAPKLAPRGIAINAVAPGFIETRMTAAMPFVIREAGRRMNSLSQGGQPQDVAEAITFLSTPGAGGITGQVLRVCGQSLIGA